MITDDWVEHHFDLHAPELGADLHRTLARARTRCPIMHSDQHDGYGIATRYEDVLRTAQDRQTWSNELGITAAGVKCLLRRLDDLRLQDGTEIRFPTTFNRAPLAVPITFTAVA